jgi:UDP-glucuronate 4-epimerase
MRILVTGSAGFIGFPMAGQLLGEGHEVVGLDGFTPYYDRNLKLRWQEILLQRPGFSGHEATLEDFATLRTIMATNSMRFTPKMSLKRGS